MKPGKIVSDDSRLAALLEAAGSISSAMDIDALARRLLEHSRAVMGCEVCSFSLPDEQGEGLRIRSTQGELAGRALIIAKGKGIAWQVYESGVAVRTMDAQADTTHDRSVEVATGLRVHAMMTIPLKEGVRILGVMQAMNPLAKPAFDAADQRLFEAFGNLIAVTLVRLERQAMAVRQAEIETSQAMARKVMESFVPAREWSGAGLVARAFWQQSEGVGGDFYFIERVNFTKALVGVGDITSKGFAAALDMARTTALIRTAAADLLEQVPFKTWVEILNNNLAALFAGGRSAAMAMALVDRTNGTAELCTCGQVPPWIRSDGQWHAAPCQKAPALGLRKNLAFEPCRIKFGAGDALLFLTDGITECAAGGVEFTTRVDHALSHDGSAATAFGRIAAEWTVFARSATRVDDATMLLIEAGEMDPNRMRGFVCDPAGIALAREFCAGILRSQGIDESEVGLVILGLDEILTNIYRHAYGGRGGDIVLEIALRASGLELVIEHMGVPGSPAPPARPIDRRPGGRGLAVIRRVFHEFAIEGTRPPWTIRATRHLAGTLRNEG